MTALSSNIAHIQKKLEGNSCKLVGVSKTKPVSLLQEAYDLGLKVFGENKAQELAVKYEEMPKDIEWHMIGHLQTNKVKMIAPFVHLIHSVDSQKVLKEINKRAAQNERVIDCLLQVHIAEEESKYGLSEEELMALLENPATAEYKNVCLKGLMGLATYTEDMDQVRQEFRSLKHLFEKIKDKCQLSNVDFTEISMGMSGDFPVAVQEGSTIVRVGSAIFGARN